MVRKIVIALAATAAIIAGSALDASARMGGMGGHSGGDLLLLEDLFASGKKKDPLGRAAGHLDGARSVLTGVAANQSFATGQPVQIDQLLKI